MTKNVVIANSSAMPQTTRVQDSVTMSNVLPVKESTCNIRATKVDKKNSLLESLCT